MKRQQLRLRVGPSVSSALLIASLALPALGQPIVMLNANASRCAIFRALSPQVPQACQVRYREVVIHEAGAPAPAQRPYLFATRIQFAFDSFELTAEARQFLDNVAEVLQDPIVASAIVQIEGHADRSGPTAYNLILSQKRALAVQRYLHAHHGIALGRLPVIGKGEREPYDLHNPWAPVNRRVQFVNISSAGGQG